MRSATGLRAAASAAVYTLLAVGATAAGLTAEVASLVDGYVPVDSPRTFQSQLKPCPASCSGNINPSNWTVYDSVERLGVCDQPMLLDFSIYNPLDDPNTHSKILACTVGDAEDKVNALFANQTSADSKSKRDSSLTTTCTYDMTAAKQINHTVSSLWSDASGKESADLGGAFQQMQQHFSDEGYQTNCDDPRIMFSYSKSAIVGVYMGSAFDKSSVTSTIERLTDEVKDGLPESVIVQLCGSQGSNMTRNANHVFGVAVNTKGDLAAVQKAVRAWSNAECVENTSGTEERALSSVKILEDGSDLLLQTFANRTLTARFRGKLTARSDCTTKTVFAGDSCGSLASRCGISASDFTKYNSASDLCSTLQAGEQVCCSSGTLPDIRPKPQEDGTCATYFVVGGDNCSKLAASNGLKLSDIEKFNNGTTWGWNGCNNLMASINICLSEGKPPMPAPVANALCGPTKPGSQPPGEGQNLTDLNPCPLKACCNIWGQCGITEDFCSYKPGPAGNPGTSPPGTNGCVMNCGTDIVNNDQAPASYGHVGYYESWNWDRPCLHLRADRANMNGYSHIHWAFATIESKTWAVKINDTYKQWDLFKGLKDVKRVVSFGGWGYSTDPGTYDILRDAMNPANRDGFVNSVVAFVNAEGIDGVDFDWEYPGAPDIPGIPAGLETDAPNYLKFLSVLRSRLPSEKTLSIAAPASYWYLKAFPIDTMAKLLDYIVYMTYDLHGQWDAGNQWASPGCPQGNCLRSHVNLTETEQALAMITKAGVPTYKIMVGEATYGRSFKMAEEGCTDATCLFTGDRLTSYAAKGRCTETAGYISMAEINEIIDIGDNEEYQTDLFSNADGDYLVYNKTEWVSYMSKERKDVRRAMWGHKNFGGTIEWAIDLEKFDPLSEDGGTDGSDDDDDLPDGTPLPYCNGGGYTILEDLSAALDSDNIPRNCKPQYALETLNSVLKDSLKRYNDLMAEGYDHKFDIYAGAVAGSAGKQVKDFVENNGNKYFTCVVTEWQMCCSQCKENHPSEFDYYCGYCFDGGCYSSKRNELLGIDSGFSNNTDAPGNELMLRGDGSPTQPLKITYTNSSEPCPPDYSKRGLGHDTPYEDTVYWTLPDDKRNSFFADILSTTGIDSDHIQFKDVNNWGDCNGQGDNCEDSNWDFGIPVPKDYGKDDVTNPKDVISTALGKLKDLSPQIEDVLDAMDNLDFFDDANAILDSLALPVTMIAEAIDSMDQVVDIADEIEEEKRKAIIMAFLSAIFFFVPVVGELASSVAALAGIGRIVAILGEVGNTALDVYTVVDTKGNDPLTIFSIVLAPLAIADIAAMAKAAGARRAMKAEELGKLGKNIGSRMDIIKKVTGTCARRP